METTKTTALEKTIGQSHELQATQASSGSVAEIQGAILIAMQYPRNEDAAIVKLASACKSLTFAEEAIYKFPRGGSRDCAHEWDWNIERCKRCNAALINGPSVAFAREAARIWGNNRSGIRVITDTDEFRLIEGWAWDLETNRQVSYQTQFKKLVYRKGKGWLVPDERDLRELTNRQGAILVRNCLLELFPKHITTDSLRICVTTMTSEVKQNPDAQRKMMILAFSDIGVSVEMLEKNLGHKIAESSPTEIANLRAAYKSIADGQATWKDYTNGNGKEKDKKPEAGAITPIHEATIDGVAMVSHDGIAWTRVSTANDQKSKEKPDPQKKEDRPLNTSEWKLVMGIAKKRGFKDEAEMHGWLASEFNHDGGLISLPVSRLDELLKYLTEKM